MTAARANGRRVRWRWIVLVAAVGVVILALASYAQGACFDSEDPASSYCTSDSLIPAAALPYVLAGYMLFAAFGVYRALRREKSGKP